MDNALADNNVNVTEIMRKIKENTEKRRALQCDGPQAPSKSPVKNDDGSDEILYLIKGGYIQNDDYKITSHRNLLGPILVGGRKLVHDEVRRYLDPIVSKQNEFNYQVIGAIESIKKENMEHIKNMAQEKTPRAGEWKNEIDDIGKIASDVNYYTFEDRFQGSRNEIKQRQMAFAPFFRGCRNVLDIGCGRGEFLELMRENGVNAQGIDIDDDMVEYCQCIGYKVVKIDALACLERTEDKSLDGIFVGRVIEYLEPDYLIRMLKLCREKLKFGFYIVIETANPLSMTSLANFYIDTWHKKPIHPETLKYLASMAGFRDLELKFANPVLDEYRLKKIDTGQLADESLKVALAGYNDNVGRLNDVLFGPQEYSVTGKK